MKNNRKSLFLLVVFLLVAFSLNAQEVRQPEDIVTPLADTGADGIRSVIGPDLSIVGRMSVFAFPEETSVNSSRRRSSRSSTTKTPLTGLTYFLDDEGVHLGFVASFGVPAPQTITFRERYVDGTQKEIPPPIVVTADHAGFGQAGWIYGSRFWGEPLHNGVVAFEAEYSGTLNFTIVHGVAAGSGPIKDMKVDPVTGRILLELNSGYYGYEPAAFVFGRNVSVEPGLWITPPEGLDFHGPNVPVTGCVGFLKVECSTFLVDIPLESANQ